MCRLQVFTLGYLILMQCLRKHVVRQLPLEKGVVNELFPLRTGKMYAPEMDLRTASKSWMSTSLCKKVFLVAKSCSLLNYR